jgi:hypothetical protein
MIVYYTAYIDLGISLCIELPNMAVQSIIEILQRYTKPADSLESFDTHNFCTRAILMNQRSHSLRNMNFEGQI